MHLTDCIPLHINTLHKPSNTIRYKKTQSTSTYKKTILIIYILVAIFCQIINIKYHLVIWRINYFKTNIFRKKKLTLQALIVPNQ